MKINTAYNLGTIIFCITAGFFGMYAGIEIDKKDWMMVWVDISALAFCLRGVIR